MFSCARMVRPFLLSLCLVSGAAAAFAQTPAPAGTLGAEPFSSSRPELMATSAAMPVNPRYEAQILFEEGFYKISATGLMTVRHRLVYRVDSADGVKDWSEISENWDPWYEKPVQLKARVLEPGGRFVELDQKTVTDAPVKADDSDTFSSEHVRRAPLPGLSIGAIVEQTETTEEKVPYFAAGSLYRFGFQWPVPAARIRLVVELPATMPYKDIVRNVAGVQVERTEEAGVRRIVYQAPGAKPGGESDIDLSTNTPNLMQVEFATGASWASIAGAYAALADPQTVTAEAKAIVPDGLPEERMARMRAIVARLHREVRYTGVEFGEAKLTPQRPAEVIARHYGDCKDKATLLVAMLRSAGVPANLALLATGPGRDVDPTLPGMNRFDHAIVYVPAGKAAGEPAVWIDATASFNEVGTLPYDDQARLALIISPETTTLTQTPVPTIADSTLVETRTFTLASLGPSHVEEVSETHGYIDANYRSAYGGAETPKLHEELNAYAGRAYLAKSVAKIEHTDGNDLEHPFRLKLVVDGAKRGASYMNEAVVAIFPNATVNDLPRWFSTPAPVEGPDMTPEARAELLLARERRATSYSQRPYTSEQRFRILVPAGFTLRSLPADKVTPIGPGSLTEHYSSAEAGVVTASLRFESGPATLTVEQALAMRAAVLELNKRDWVGIYFDQAGAKALAAGHIREALEADRALITTHPADGLNHARLARALLEAGIGDEAHAEARRATEIDPKSAEAFATLGWVLEHDSLGERFGKGYDLPGAIAAYKQSVALEPDNLEHRFDLGILYEFNAGGLRYGKGADMPAAIATYKALIETTKDTDAQAAAQYRENLMYALLFSEQFAELDKMLLTVPASNTHVAFAITSAAAQHGAAAGIAAAEKGNGGAGDRNRNLRTAGAQLAALHRYGPAADVLAAGIQGGDDAPTVARQIEFFRQLAKAPYKPLPASDPATPVETILVGVLSGTITSAQVDGALAKQAYATAAARQRDIDKNLAQSGLLKEIAAKSGSTEGVLLDLLTSTMKFTSTGDEAHGWVVTEQSAGAEPQHFFIVREDGSFRVVADQNDNVQLGNAVLFELAHDKPAMAKAMLDWKRDFTHKAGGDDAFAGPLLPRFWTVGSTREGADSPAAMRLAALALLAGSMEEKAYVAEIGALRDKASGQRQTDLDLLLAVAAAGAEMPEPALAASKRLLEQEPDSLVALRLAGTSYALQGDSAGWLALLTPRVAKKPADHDLLEQQSRAYALAKNWDAAQKAQQGVLDSGNATSSDYNEAAWLTLFHGKPGDDALKQAQQSNMMSKNGSFADLHTLACIYAAQGRTTEARQVLKQAMDAGNQTQPNAAVWYVLGLIYEQYGEQAAALSAYRKVEAHESDDHTYVDPVATYVLAQGRIAALGGASSVGTP